MDASFWLKLALSFLLGSAWVTLTTIAAERYGSKVGGLIGGLPSTVVMTLLFIGLTQTPRVAVDATTVIPLSMSVTGLFMLAFLSFVRHGLGAGLLAGLLVWFGLGSLLIVLDNHALWIAILVWLFLTAASYWSVEKIMRISSHGRLVLHYSAAQIAFRAFFGGTVIAFAVLMGKLGGPLWGGIFSTFPAMFLSTLVIAYKTSGLSFTRAIGKSLLVSGMLNVPLYALAIRCLYPRLALGLGTLFALLFSMVTGYLTYRFILPKMS